MTTVLRLRRDATLTPGDTTQIAGPFCSLSFGALPGGIRGALSALAEGEHTQDDLAAQVIAGDGVNGLLRFHLLLRRLDGEGLLEHSVLHEDVPIVRLRPVGRGATSWLSTPAALRLSRFATVHAEGDRLVARAPGNHLAVELSPAAAGLLAALAGWTDAATAAEAVPGIPVAEVLRLFHAAGLLNPGEPGADPESDQPAGAQWSPVELWLHATSRGPKTVSGYGGTYPNADRFGPLPVSPEPRGTRRIALPTPDLAEIADNDPSLTEVLESRRSVREHDDTKPITIAQLGELLYRAARLRQTFTGTDGQELADRPYPNGGAVHELEIYPLVRECEGAPTGLWHYRADTHELDLVAEPGPATTALLEGARDAAVMTMDPQITLLISARFGRILWKYEAVGYALVLKHVGVLYQTIYLIGTAMGLAVCGLGGGDAAQFAAASGLDPRAESSVGELVLGSRPAVLTSDIGVPRPEGPAEA